MNIPGQITLRVAESLPKDVGRGIARLDPELIKKIKIQIGETLEIEGKRKTVVKAMPTFQDMRGKGIVQIDGLIRHNAGVGIDEKVTLAPVESQPARKILLTPLTVSLSGRTRHSYLGKIMEGLRVMVEIRVGLCFSELRLRNSWFQRLFPTAPL